MEPARLPMGSSMNFNLLKDQDNPNATAYIDSNNNLYQINFYKKSSSINISCHNTSRDTNKIYTYELTLEEIKQAGVYSTIDQMLNFCQKLNNAYNCQIEKGNDYIILRILINENKKLKLKLLKEINTLKDVIAQIKNLIKENEYLKIRLDKIEKENELMKLNYFYNSFDTKAYTLENIYRSLISHSLTIKNKYDLRLINQGVKFLFNKIISNLKILYYYKDDFDPITYQSLHNQLNFYVIVVYTKDKRKFGALCNKQRQKNIIMNNMIINNCPNFGNIGMNNMGNNNPMMINIVNNNNNMMNNINMNNNQNAMINNMQNNQQNNINQNIMNQKNSFQTMNNKEVFSSSSSLNEYFVFSLDNYKLYYCDKVTTDISNVPNFTIFFDANRQSLYGTEFSVNNNNLANSQSLVISQQSLMPQQNIGQQMNNPQSNLYKLSGKNEFNIKYFEIFDIELN